MSRARSGGRWCRAAATLLLVTLTALHGSAAMAVDPAHPGHPNGHQRSSRDDTGPTTGLAVSIDSIVPAHLTPGERVRLSGVITNLDDKVWRDLQVYLVIAPSPMTTSEQLAASLASPATAYAGEQRVIDPGLYLELGSLQAGESTSYQLDVPFGDLGLLSRAPGVYSIGVHVVATDADGGRDPFEPAGRARSYIPLMAEQVDTPVDLSLVWPFQARVERAADGTYLNADALAEQAASGGHLRRMLDMALAAGGQPLTVVVDPAVLDAYSRLADGSTCAGPRNDADALPQTAAQQGSAREFLRDVTALAQDQPLWSQWYARADPAALTSRPGSGLRYAVDRATVTTLDRLGLSGRRVYVPIQHLDPAALASLDDDLVALVEGDEVPGWQLDDGPVARVGTPQAPLEVIVADRGLTEGGPVPGPTDTALQVRQRILSESAMLSLESSLNGVDTAGMVFVAAPSWDPGPSWPSAGFFPAFDAPWLEVVPLDSQLSRGPADPVSQPTATRGATQALPPALIDTAERIARRARTVRAVTDGNPEQRACSDEAVALAVSEHWRNDPATGLQLARAALAGLDEQLAAITVEAPEVVTLSSSSGRFPITITNGLEQPVTVGVRITADDGSMTFDDIGPVVLRRDDSTTFTVRTTQAADVGVIDVTATLTTPSGRAFGQQATISLRTSVVGVVVWVALAAAAALMGLAVVRRLRRRGRGGARATAKPVRTSP